MPAGLRLRYATPGDSPFIQRLHEDAIRGAPGNHYSRAELESWAVGLKVDRYAWAMNHGGEVYLVADIVKGGGRLAGFCSYGSDQIYGLYVHPTWTGRGLAGAMLTIAERALIA